MQTQESRNGPFARFLRDRGHALVHKIAKLAVILLIILLDPFGFQASLLDASRRFEDRVSSALYPARSHGNIAVVALVPPRDDWPWGWDRWANTLERLEGLGVAAVLLDVELATPRGSAFDVADLEDFMRSRREPGRMPVVLVDNGRAMVTNPVLRDCPEVPGQPTALEGRRHRSTLAGDLACSATALAFYDWPVEKDNRAYPLYSLHLPHPLDGPTAQPALGAMPAAVLAGMACDLALAERPGWCDRPDPTAWLRPPSHLVEALSHGDGKEAKHALPLSLRPVWPLGAVDRAFPPDDTCLDHGTRGQATGVLTAGLVLAQELVGRLVPLLDLTGQSGPPGQGWPRLGTPCPVPRQVVLAPGSPLSAPGTPLGEPAPPAQAQLEEQLRGRIVLVGDARLSSSDILPSPIRGRVSGVTLHAVVLENLLTQGPDAPRVDRVVDFLWLGLHVERGKLFDLGLKLLIIAASFLLLYLIDLACQPGTAPAGWLRRPAAHARGLATWRFVRWLGQGGDHGGWRAQLAGMAVRSLFSAGVLAGLAFLALWAPTWVALSAFVLALAGLVAWAKRPLRMPDTAPAADGTGVLGLVALSRLAIFAAVVVTLILMARLGTPSASPLLVLLVALSVIFPVLDHWPLDEAGPAHQ